MGARFRNIYFLIFIFILDISCQHLGNTCQLNLYTGIEYILPTIGGYKSVGGFLPQGPTVRGSIVHPEKVDSWAPGPNCPGPNCPPPKSGQLGPGAQLSGAQLSRGPTVRGPTVRGPNCPGPNSPGPNCPGPNCPGPNSPRTLGCYPIYRVT